MDDFIVVGNGASIVIIETLADVAFIFFKRRPRYILLYTFHSFRVLGEIADVEFAFSIFS